VQDLFMAVKESKVKMKTLHFTDAKLKLLIFSANLKTVVISPLGPSSHLQNGC